MANFTEANVGILRRYATTCLCQGVGYHLYIDCRKIRFERQAEYERRSETVVGCCCVMSGKEPDCLGSETD